MQILFATNNIHKVQEVQSVMPKNFSVLSLPALRLDVSLHEHETTIEGNAISKVKQVWTVVQKNKWSISCFADDSGLEVAALNNAPGVHSARYYSQNATDVQNIKHLLDQMQGIAERQAQFRTVIALIHKERLHLFTGIVKGTILTFPKGNSGFGYDPLFLPNGYQKTFAQMTMQEKNRCSHRYLAVEKMISFFAKMKATG